MVNPVLILAALVSLTFPATAQSALPEDGPVPGSGLLAPVLIKANDGFIDVTTGHAAPYVMDYDGDGVWDLLVGEFGDGEFPAERLPQSKGKFVHGRLRIYRNHGSAIEPRFEGFQYLMAGDQPASIPVT